jgi:acyl transferase domain-containing protein/NAD(P)-dependent dehydrogenase (short-subunit alcohol dehydrogenase family)/acyl carrier protein
VFAQAFRESLDAFASLSGQDLRPELEKARPGDTPPTALAQWLNFALQYGLTRLWQSFGVEPDVLLGHSVGEIPAALAAAELSFEDAALIAYHRGLLQQSCEGKGGMLAVELDEAGFKGLPAELTAECEIAAFNAPSSITLAGPVPALMALQELFDERGVFSRLLKVKVPYHSRAMDGIREPFLAAISKITSHAPRRLLLSSVTGAAEGPRSADYWWKNVREPVQFERAVAAIDASSVPIVLQLGPHAVLTPSLKSCFAARLQNPAILHSLHRDRPEVEALLEALGGLYCAGAKLDWDVLAPQGRRLFDLPAYPWQRELHWHESQASLVARCGPQGHVLLQAPVESSVPTWHTELTDGYFAYMQDHRAEDRALFPATALLEIAIAVNGAVRGAQRTRLENVGFHSTLLLSDSMHERIEIRFDPGPGSLSVSHRLDGAQGSWPLLCTGTISQHQPEPGSSEPLETALQGYTRIESPLYIERSASYFYFGPRWRSIKSLSYSGESFIAELVLPPGANPHDDSYALHPALLDGAFQSAVFMTQQVLTRGDADGILVPVSLDRLDFFQAPGDVAWCRGKLREYSPRSLELDLELFDSSGQMCSRLTGARWGFVRTRHELNRDETRGLLYTPTAIELERPAATAATAGKWLVVGDPTPAREALSLALSEAGHRVEQVDWRSEQPVAALDPNRLKDVTGVVYLAEPAEVPSGQAASTKTALVLSLFQALAAAGSAPRACIVTRAAAPASGDPERCAHPELTALWGVGRAIGNERGGGELLLADLPQEASERDWQALASELGEAQPRRQLLIRDGRVRSLRLEPLAASPATSAPRSRTVPTSESVALAQPGGQRIENLCWQLKPRRAPGPGEVEIQVQASALNFKDLMKVTGLISDAVTRGTFLGEDLGMECAGVVTRVGSGVSTWKPGDAVVAITAGSFASYVTCSEATLLRSLPGATPEQSVVYATFATVVQALERVAQLDEGERILIHSAAGALGLAAIQYAKSRGARIFATASSEAKREYLGTLGVEQVSDSRSLAFVDEVRAWSGGRGVDVVLNFLAGEPRLQSLALLAAGGRFVEVGKPGGALGAQIPARLFNTNMSFANIDLDQLMRQTPQKMRALSERVIELFEQGHFQALPTQVFAPDQAQAAFQLMARAAQIGKVVLRVAGGEVSVPEPAGARIRPDRSYWVTGAFGGFGLSVCRWLADRGAKTLVLQSRNGPSSPEARRTLAVLEAQGTQVHVVQGDVGDLEVVTSTLKWIERDLPPLAGVVHAAMLLDDGVFTAMTPERVERVFHPKASGAFNLHLATRSCQLDFFLLFSSIAGLTGGVGQSNYAAANAFLDGLARHRRELGLPATSINWGVLSESGVVARNPMLMRLLGDQGVMGLSDQEALGALDLILEDSPASVACIKLDWDLLAGGGKSAGGSPFLADLVESAKPNQRRIPAGLAQLLELLADHSESPLEAVEASVGTLVAGVLRTSLERVELRRPLSVAGVDSLMATELSVALFREYGTRFTVLDLLRTLSVADVAKVVLSRAQAAQQGKA